jgi:hypothetical protein
VNFSPRGTPKSRRQRFYIERLNEGNCGALIIVRPMKKFDNFSSSGQMDSCKHLVPMDFRGAGVYTCSHSPD